MIITLQHNELTIQLFDDPAFNQKADSPTSYDKVIQTEEDKQYSPTSQHAIKIYQHNILISSCIILATGGGTGVHSDTAIIDGDRIIIRCCNKLFSLSIPSLETYWMVKADWATCFSFYRYQDTYISHGEHAVARIDKNGKILWSFSGADIFVCLYEGNPFEIHDTYIALTDFNGSTYKIDYDGNSLDYKESNYSNQEPITVLMKPQKRWWKFW